MRRKPLLGSNRREAAHSVPAPAEQENGHHEHADKTASLLYLFAFPCGKGQIARSEERQQ